LRVLVALLGVAGAGLVALRAPRLGLSLFAFAVAASTALPRSTTTAALFDGSAWTTSARVDGSPHGAENVAPISLERAGPELPALRVSGRVRLSLAGSVGPGDELLLRARFVPPGRRCNPGVCDATWRAAAEGVDGTAVALDPTLVLRAGVAPAGFGAQLWALRRAMAHEIEITLPAAEAALLAALVVGERASVGTEEEARFRAVGVTHLLSVSGLHLAFAAGLLFAAARRLLAWFLPALGRRRPRDRSAALFALPVVAAYALLTGAEVATVRAALVVGFAFVGVMSARRVRGLDALSFAALAITVARPASLTDPSFQLSFTAALATLLVVRPAVTHARGWLARFVLQLFGIALASFAATVATAPLTALHFSQVAPMGVLSNPIAVPLTEMAIVPLGLIGALLALLGGGHSVLHLAGFLTAILLALVRSLSAYSPVIAVAAPSPLVFTIACAGLLWVGVSARPRLLRLCVVGGVVLSLLAGERLWARLFPAVEVVFLDVGQGDAAVIFLPSGEVLVVDGGPDPGAQALVPFLRRRGVTRVDLVVLSHPHPDHAGGLAELLRQLPVGELWTNGQPSSDPTVRALLAEAAARRVPLGAPRSLRYGAVRIDVLGPIDEHGLVAADSLASENDSSLVLRLCYARRCLLFAGDIESAGEAALLAHAPGGVDLLKVPHHGSRTSSGDELLDALHPRYAIASLAEGNRYRFPHPDVVARYRERSVRFLRTDRDGAVRARVQANGEVEVSCTRAGACGEAE
jgi:competence protein ComEC